MKPIHGDTGSNESCSCTSCDYSDSDRQSLRRLRGQGSRIDRLFTGKYIPLRESKLLEKLIRTRALYDNVRNELLSSSLSVSSKTDLKRRQIPKGKALEEVKKNNDILTLVDLVERGSVLRSRNLSECCSCCNCNSKIRLHEPVQKGRRLRQTHVGGNITSRSSVMSRHGTGEELRLRKKFKAKNIKSDPCTCACDVRELIKLQSRVILKKIRPEQPTPITERKPFSTITDKHKFMTVNNEKLRKPYRKLKRSNLHSAQYIENTGEGFKTVRNLKPSREKVDPKEIKSIQRLKFIEQKIKENFEADRKAMQKFKQLEVSPDERIAADNFIRMKKGSKVNLKLGRQKLNSHLTTGRKTISKLKFIHFSPVESIPTDSVIRIKKNSLIKVKDKIGAHRQDWELKRREGRKSGTKYPIEKDKKKILLTSSPSNASVRKNRNVRYVQSATKSAEKKSTLPEPPFNIEIRKRLREARVGENQMRKKNEIRFSREKTRSVKSMTDLSALTSTDVVQNPEERFPLSGTKSKVPIKSKTRISDKLLKSISTNSMEKSTPFYNKYLTDHQKLHKTSSLNLFNRFSINRPKPSISHVMKMKLLEAPLRYEPRKPHLHKKSNLLKVHKPLEEPDLQKELRMHNKPHDSKPKHMMKNIRAGSHGLTRCLCTLKIKVKKTKSKKNITKEIPKIKVTESSQTRTKLRTRGSSTKKITPDMTYQELRSNSISLTKKRGTNYHSVRVDTVDRATSTLSHEFNINSKEHEYKYQPDQLKTRSETKSTSFHASECKCFDINISSKEKLVTKQQPSKMKIDSQTKHIINQPPSKCGCHGIISTIGEKPGAKYHTATTNTLHLTKSISRESNHEVTNASMLQPVPPNIYSVLKSTLNQTKCECQDTNITNREKQPILMTRSKYKPGQTNTYLELKNSLNRTSKEKRGIQYHNTQNSQHASKCECPVIHIVTRVKREMTKGQENVQVALSAAKLKTSKPTLRSEIKVGDTKKNIQFKSSPLSNSTGKSKYTITKHRLRRCFCTLKLGKNENKEKKLKKKNKPVTIPGSVGKIPKTQLRNVSISTNREIYHSQMKKIVQPYECVPGFCVPGQCEPNICKKILTKAQNKKLKKRIRPLGGNNRKTRSNSSLISRSLHLPKVKNIHSLKATHRSEDTIQILEKKKTIRLPDSSTQQVRPSFAIQFLKGNLAKLDSIVGKNSEIESEIKKNLPNDFKHEEDLQKQHKSTVMRNKRPDRSFLLASVIQRCLCALKSHKKRKSTMKNSAISTDESAKSTKSKHSNQLKAFECEPYICIPGDCLKYNCLDRIKKHSNIRSSKDFGITHKVKMISKSSETRRLKSISKMLLVQSDFQPQKSAMQTYKKMRKYSDISYLHNNAAEIYSERIIKRGVRIGSNFNFNIEFSKDRSPVKNLKNQRVSKNINEIKVEELLNRSNSILKSLFMDVKAQHKLPKLSSMLKRCFCTLKLLTNGRQHLGSKSTPYTLKKPTQVYAVSKVTVAKTKMNSPEMLLLNEIDLSSHCVDSYDPAKYTKEALNQTKLWQYFKSKSSSSVLSISTIAFRSKKIHSYLRKSKLLHIDPINMSLVDITSKDTLRFQSKFSCQVNYIENIHTKKNFLRSAQSLIDTFALRESRGKYLENRDTFDNTKIKNQTTNPSQLTGVQPLLRRSYCTMNIQVSGQQGHKKRQYEHNQSKLKDYECEPGVCIPYECDPYECQKLIMKRLMRKVSKMSGTDRRLKNSSSLTSTMSASSTSRKLQSSLIREQKHHVAKARPTGLKYQTLPRSLKTHRQAVRVGSAFSFDIEFSKGKSKPAPVREYTETPKRSTTRSSKTHERHRRDRGTGGFGRGRHDRESQSMIRQMRHRASSVTPMLKRCFCTLKLQKKGRQQRERERANQGTSTPPNYRAENQILRTTEAGQNTKTRKMYSELLPYECEPNICVPGECDPYECLELIKKRRAKQTKEFGTDSMTSKISSSASMTASQKRTKRRHVQSRNIRAKPVKSRDTEIRSKPSIMSIEKPRTDGSRQAVRLGSSFSFNVEFYKDKNSTQKVTDRRPPKTPKEVRKVPKHVYVHKKLRESSSQDEKFTRDTNSQIGLRKHGRSTMTNAFLKRCFCTAKLHGIKIDAGTKTKQHFGESISVLKRCFCTLKTFRTAKKVHYKTADTGNEKVTPLATTHVGKTQTRVRHRERLRERTTALKPYECEPGVCIPGSCDPYECEKMIRRRRAKEKNIGTTGPRTKSTSSSFTSSGTSKARMTQSKYQAKPTQKVKKPPRKEIVIKEKSRLPVIPQRQAVRIGSTFSFDIEFYKDKFPNYHQVQAAATTVKRSRPTRDQAHGANYATSTRDVGLKGRGTGLHSRESQMDAAKKEDKALGPILKRCFCTLKLQKQKQPIKQAKRERPKQQGTSTPVTKEVPTLQTRSVMAVYKPKVLPYELEPYECEPGVCIPGQCDPYECQKRINRRLMNRESGTLTDRHQTRSASNMVRPYRKHRDSEVQSVTQRKKKLKSRDIQSKVGRPEPRTIVAAGRSRQAVKIGSSFSFNVDFFKDRSLGSRTSSIPIKQYSSYEKPRRSISRFTDGRSISSRNKRAQRTRAVRDMDSQVLARSMRSTMTGVGPFLKRCFCTMQLHRTQKDKSPFNNKTHPKTYPRIQAQFGRKLEPYECEPGVCVPGECDPYECEKRIKRRMLSKVSGTESHRGRSVSSSIAELTKSRPKRTQARCDAPCRKNEYPCPGKNDQIRVKDRVTYDTSRNQQAVRIGSSFSFNVEFFKDKSQLPTQRDVNNIPKIKHNTHIGGTETIPNRNRSISSSSRRARLRDCQSQSNCIKTECKASCAPLLKRCFCTLKLQKMGKHQKFHKIEPTTRTMGTRTPFKNKEIQPAAREIGTKTKKYNYNLEPYECEPGVCIPGQCNPYECEKRIRLRYMRDYGTETNRAAKNSMSSLTYRNQGTKSINTQVLKEKKHIRRKPSTKTIYRHKRAPRTSHVVENLNRQAVRLGSNFSFNIEFYKDRSSNLNDSKNKDIQSYYKQPAKHKSRTSISTGNRIKSRNHGTYCREKLLNNTESQVGATMESRGSGMGPLLKRCFCTLTLQRAEVKSTLNTPMVKNKPIKFDTLDKTTSTKKKYIPPPVPVQQLEPYECEPGVCTPGECNPYECLERIKKRGVRRMSRTTGTRMKRTSQVSVSSMAAQLMPGYNSKRTQLKEFCSPQKVERIVEEPRFPFLCGNTNTKQIVRISSNFDFNIEFIKEYSPEEETTSVCPDKEICRAKDLCTQCNKSGKMKIGQHGTRPSDLQSQESQSECVKTEDKSSAAAILRRCFCTAKLHKTHLARTHPQTVTVGRVEDNRPFPIFGPKEYCVQYQFNHPAKCKSKYCKSTKTRRYDMEATYFKNRGTNPNKLETIMSYTPSKFNKTSRIRDSVDQNATKTRSNTIGKGEKQSIITQDTQEINDSTLKKMFCRCKYLFSKHTNENFQENGFKSTGTEQADFLKPSKSERRPNNTVSAGLKKSKSLKVAKITERNAYHKAFSRFESGDTDQTDITNKSQISAKKIVTKTCPCCQCQFQQDMSINKQVHFSLSPKSKLKLRKRKQDAALLDEEEEEPKSVSFEVAGSKDSKKKEITVNNVITTNNTGAKLTKPGKKTGKKVNPEKCICGSPTCKKVAEQQADSVKLKLKNKRKKCVCGTEICARESYKEAKLAELGFKRVQKKKKSARKREQELKDREEMFRKEDEEITRRRKIKDKYMLKKLKQYKETSDVLLLAESVLDIGKLGITSAGDILRNVFRTVIDPIGTYRNIKMYLQNPSRAWKKFQDAANDGPGVATLKRIKLRCQAMKCVQANTAKLEEFPVTNYMVHINDADPKRRLNPKRPRRPRPDPAFNCSPFMLSLRKRPWLGVYYMCGWFYPHCLSLLQVWRQFSDIVLFLLAVVVWCPCIAGMEICRALMCCFLCTG